MRLVWTVCFALLGVHGCGCRPAIVENRSTSTVEVMVRAISRSLLRASDSEMFRSTVAPGETWEASCNDRVAAAGHDGPDIEVRALGAHGRLGRTWDIDLEQDSPKRLLILGDDGDLRFRSVRPDGTVRPAHFLAVSERVYRSDGAPPSSPAND